MQTLGRENTGCGQGVENLALALGLETIVTSEELSHPFGCRRSRVRTPLPENIYDLHYKCHFFFFFISAFWKAKVLLDVEG